MANVLRNLRRASLSPKSTEVSQPQAESAPSSTLAQFLSTSKQRYLSDLRETPSKGGEWKVVMGNEAGDLDSIASSIAFAWIESEVNKRPTIPLLQLQRDDLTLRAENIYALKLAGLDDPQQQLLFLTDVAEYTPFPSHNFVLVDHNRLGSLFTKDNPDAQVTAVIDHHDDEGLYKDTANPRVIASAGSCSSHVAALAPLSLPSELTTLLMCAILIDTSGLKPGGKAEQVDRDAANAITPRTNFELSISTSDGQKLHEEKAIKALTKELSTRKTDLSQMSGWDLLRRDYKEYEYTLPWAPNTPSIKAGLSTVPLRLKAWGSNGRLEKDAAAWMESRNLTVLGVLTTFKTEKKGLKKGGKHKREMAWIVLDTGNVDVSELASRLWEGLAADQTVNVKRHKKFDDIERNSKLPANAKARVYVQKNVEATRKAVAPLLKSILEKPLATPVSTAKSEQPKAATGKQ